MGYAGLLWIHQAIHRAHGPASGVAIGGMCRVDDSAAVCSSRSARRRHPCSRRHPEWGERRNRSKLRAEPGGRPARSDANDLRDLQQQFRRQSSYQPLLESTNGGTTWSGFGSLTSVDKSLAWRQDGVAALAVTQTLNNGLTQPSSSTPSKAAQPILALRSIPSTRARPSTSRGSGLAPRARLMRRTTI